MTGSATHVDVIVVGSGLSGLVAASELKHYDPGISLLVLEASDRVGGRVHTSSDGCDLGGEFLVNEEGHKPVLTLLDQLGVATERVRSPAVGEKWVFWGSRSARPVTLNKLVPSFSLTQTLASLEMRHLVWRMQRLADGVDVRHPYSNRPLATALDAITVRSYLKARCHFSRNADAFELRVRLLFGRESSQISMLYLLTYAQSCGGVGQLVGAGVPRPLFVVKGGVGAVCQRLAKRIGTDAVLTNQPVNSISEYEGKLYVSTRTDQTFVCGRVICALPPSAVARIDFHPSLPARTRNAFSNFSMGSMIKFVLAYDRPYWREDGGFSGETVCLGEGTEAPFVYLYDSTRGEEKQEEFTLTGIISGSKALEYSDCSDDDLLQHNVIEALTALYGSWATKLKRPAEIKYWNRDAFCGGGPIATPRPGTMEHVYAVREPFGRVHFASSEAATKWMAHIAGAVRSGTCAAIEVIDELRPQALAAPDFRMLGEARLTPEEREQVAKVGGARTLSRSPSYSNYGKAVYRWTFVLPVCAIAAGYLAVTLRDRYAYLFVPMHT